MQTISQQCPQGYHIDYKEIAKTHDKSHYKTVSQQQVSIDSDMQKLQHERQSNDGHQQQPSFLLRMFFSYLYFSQGLVIALCVTIPYIYPQLPSYSVMTIFNATLLPFSFKFLLAPLIEKYTLFKYGKRKFWIVMAQCLVAGCLFVSAMFTEFQQSKQLALILFAMIFFVTLQDISLDSLAKKQLKHAHITSSVSVTNQLTGNIIGSMLLLKLTSIDFAHFIGLQHPIISLSTYLLILSLVILLPSIIIHFVFTQTHNQQQLLSTQMPLSKIYLSYKIFFNLKTKYCRTVLFLLIINQGFNLFLAGFDYELVKAGFSRDTNNTIQNVVAIPVNVIACFMTVKIEHFGTKKGIVIATVGQLMIFSFLRMYFPLDILTIAITTFFASIFSMWLYMITVIFIYEFPLSRFTGMYITFFASVSNLGSNTTLHTKLLDKYGWWTVSWVGLWLQVWILAIVYYWMFQWKDQGKLDINDDDKGEIHQNNNKSIMQNQLPTRK